MRRSLSVVAAIAVAGAIAVPLSIGSSHREAPGTSIDPTVDDTDIYAFTANDAPGSLTVVSNWIPFEDPAGGPNFYGFDPAARYYVNVDNTGDGKPDVRYLFKFKTRVKNPRSFLYAVPKVESIGDADLNVTQNYSVTRLVYKNGKPASSKVVARGIPVAPNNVGPKTIPNYSFVAKQAERSLPGGGKVFAGQRDDPFYVDLGGTFDAINLRSGTGNQGGGKDDLAGYSTHSIVLQVPESDVTRDGKAVSAPDASNAVVGVWSSTERKRIDVRRKGRRRTVSQKWVQVSRLGNPLVNEVVIPIGMKDKFNSTTPDKDAQYAEFVVEPELVKVLNALYDLGIKEKDRTDIVTALLTGVPGLTQISKDAVPADTLKINLGVPPTASPDRFGVIAGDNAGFPNGRRLGDDVVDIELRVIGGFLVPADQGGKKLPLGDGVDQNDKAFSSTFPYVAEPASGFDSDPKRTEPAHEPTP